MEALKKEVQETMGKLEVALKDKFANNMSN